jgi:hypothetical protein
VLCFTACWICSSSGSHLNRGKFVYALAVLVILSQGGNASKGGAANEEILVEGVGSCYKILLEVLLRGYRRPFRSTFIIK